MKLIKNLCFVVMLVIVASSCKKSSDSTPSVVNGSVTGYPSKVVVNYSGSTTIYLFAYDSTNRLTKATQVAIDSSTSEYDSVATNYAYTGTSKWPTSSTSEYTSSTFPAGEGIPYSDNFTYNSNSQVTVDTTIFYGSNASIFSSASYYTYPSTTETDFLYEISNMQTDSVSYFIDTLKFSGQNATYFSQEVYNGLIGATPTPSNYYTESLTLSKYLNPLANLNGLALSIYNPTIFNDDPTWLNQYFPLTEIYGGSVNLTDTYTFDTKGRVSQVTATQTAGSGNNGYTEIITY